MVEIPYSFQDRTSGESKLSSKVTMEYLQQIKGLIRPLPKAHIKSKTVQRDGIELTIELQVKESEVDFVDKFLRVQGVYDATLVAHQGDLLS